MEEKKLCKFIKRSRSVVVVFKVLSKSLFYHLLAIIYANILRALDELLTDIIEVIFDINKTNLKIVSINKTFFVQLQSNQLEMK